MDKDKTDWVTHEIPKEMKEYMEPVLLRGFYNYEFSDGSDGNVTVRIDCSEIQYDWLHKRALAEKVSKECGVFCIRGGEINDFCIGTSLLDGAHARMWEVI